MWRPHWAGIPPPIDDPRGVRLASATVMSLSAGLSYRRPFVSLGPSGSQSRRSRLVPAAAAAGCGVTFPSLVLSGSLRPARLASGVPGATHPGDRVRFQSCDPDFTTFVCGIELSGHLNEGSNQKTSVQVEIKTP